MSDAQTPDSDLLDKVINLAKRRGFIFQSAEIYGGFRSTYDYGPLGVNMLRNVKNAWWKTMVQMRDYGPLGVNMLRNVKNAWWKTMVQMRHDVVGLDAAILGPPAVWAASGHLETFTDPLVDCLKCHGRFREDKIDGVCPTCGSTQFTESRAFNLMFKTQAGPVEGDGATAYLRPETAQGMFTNFMNVLTTSRKKPPFGIAQVGKSFRNEITPQNFVFRTREFEQMELEFFVPPAEADEWYRYWIEQRFNWYLDLGIPADQLRLHEHAKEDLSHYSRGTTDVEYLYPWGWDELEGIANRGDYDLTQHSTHSGTKLEYYDQAANERYTPYVIEPAAGATRAMMAALRDRAGRRCHPRHDGLPARRLPRGRGRGRSPLGTASGLASGALPGGRAAPVEEARARRRQRAGAQPSAAPLQLRLRRHPVHRSSLPPPGRGRYPVLHHGRLRLTRGPRRDRS